MSYVDDSTTNQGSEAGLIIVSPEGHTYEHALEFLFKMSNNEVEYETLLVSMDLFHALEAERLKAFSDSQLVVSQEEGEYEAHAMTQWRTCQRSRRSLRHSKILR